MNPEYVPERNSPEYWSRSDMVAAVAEHAGLDEDDLNQDTTGLKWTGWKKLVEYLELEVETR